MATDLQRMAPGIFKGQLAMFPNNAGEYVRLADALAAIKAARVQALEAGIAEITSLRDSHCAATKKSPDKHDWCEHDDVACEFVLAWNEAIAILRRMGEDAGRGES